MNKDLSTLSKEDLQKQYKKLYGDAPGARVSKGALIDAINKKSPPAAGTEDDNDGDDSDDEVNDNPPPKKNTPKKGATKSGKQMVSVVNSVTGKTRQMTRKVYDNLPGKKQGWKIKSPKEAAE